jgi:pyruvate dehydrogenase E2 component (dihydrolipoamide acetyltransferase)
MATPVELPQLGNTVEECLITRWVKRAGDQVAAGDIVAEIETDKTTFEIAAPVAGTVLATFFDEGALVKVLTNLFVIGDPGEAVDAFAPGTAHGSDIAARAASPTAAPQSDVDMPQAAGAGPGTAPFSPRARRLAAQHGLDTAAIVGTGPGGRVIERDVRQAYASAAPTSRTPPASNLRATIARRMRESLSSTAQYTLHASAPATGLLTLRARLKGTPALAHVTINDLIAFCTIQALLDVPALNAEYIDGRIVERADVHLGFAVDTPRGLLAPVVRKAHTLTLSELATTAKELASRAVSGTIAPDDLAGGTFTVSNLGALGIEWFTPLINLPQVAILGVGAIQPKPARVAGRVELVDAVGLSLTCDHQVIDGAPGARFLQRLAEKIASVEAIVGV